MLSRLRARVKSDDEQLRAAQGLIAETMPRQLALGTSVPVTGNVYYTMIRLRAGQVITNLHISVTSGASSGGVTLGKIGLYAGSHSGALLAATASQTTDLESTGVKTYALTTPYTVPSDGIYYVGIITVGGGTQPTLLRGTAGSTTIMAPIGSGLRPWGLQSGQTDLPNPATVGTSGLAAFWVGAS